MNYGGTHSHKKWWKSNPHNHEVNRCSASQHHLDIVIEASEAVYPVDSYELSNSNDNQRETTRVIVNEIENIKATL